MCGSKFNKPFMVHIYHPCFYPLQLGMPFIAYPSALQHPYMPKYKHMSYKKAALAIANKLQIRTSLIAYSFLSFTKIAI